MNLYEILHIAQDAPEEIIRLAYKGLAQKYHPDRYNGADANEKMVQIREAYETLIDPIQRKKYDYFLSEQVRRRQEEEIRRQKFSSANQQSKNPEKESPNAQKTNSFKMNISIDIPEKFSLTKPFVSLRNWFIEKKGFFYKLLGGAISLSILGGISVAIIDSNIFSVATSSTQVAQSAYSEPQMNNDSYSVQDDAMAEASAAIDAATDATQAADIAAQAAVIAAQAAEAAVTPEAQGSIGSLDTDEPNLASQSIKDSPKLMRKAVNYVISTWTDSGLIGAKQKIEDCYATSQTNKLFCVYTDLAAENFHDSGV